MDPDEHRKPGFSATMDGKCNNFSNWSMYPKILQQIKHQRRILEVYIAECSDIYRNQ